MGFFKKLFGSTATPEPHPDRTLDEYVSRRALAIYAATKEIACYGKEACDLLHIDDPSEFPYLFCFGINKLMGCVGNLVQHDGWFELKVMLVGAPVPKENKDKAAFVINSINAKMIDGCFGFDPKLDAPIVTYYLHVGYDDLKDFSEEEFEENHSEEWLMRYMLYPDLLREMIGKAMLATVDYLDELASVLKPESEAAI